MKIHKILFLLLLIVQGCIQKNNPQNIWRISTVKNLPIKTSNQAVSGGFIKGKPYLFSFGGIDSTKTFSGIHQRSFRFDIVNQIWAEIPSLPVSLGKIANAASRINDTIYIIGGYHVFADGTEKSSDKVHRFDIINNVFLEDATPLQIPIDDHVQAVWKNKLIYIITGWSDNKNIADVQIFNPEKNIWYKGTSVPNNHIYKSFGASGTIIGDTIFYFGGAAMGKNYPIQNYLRKGVINPEKPTEISWSYQVIDSITVGYRSAAIKHNNQVLWIGGSSKTYNYNGIAYDKSGGVNPNTRILALNNNKFNFYFNKNIPMDLRGIVYIHDSIMYLIGGMERNQKVSNKVYKIEWK